MEDIIMKQIENFLREHSDGRDNPICSKDISSVFGIPCTAVRRMINTARSNGVPICSCQNGYYITDKSDEIKATINSLRGRIHKMECAIAGLELHLQQS